MLGKKRVHFWCGRHYQSENEAQSENRDLVDNLWSGGLLRKRGKGVHSVQQADVSKVSGGKSSLLP